jgi:hypothetical protein
MAHAVRATLTSAFATILGAASLSLAVALPADAATQNVLYAAPAGSDSACRAA